MVSATRRNIEKRRRTLPNKYFTIPFGLKKASEILQAPNAIELFRRTCFNWQAWNEVLSATPNEDKVPLLESVVFEDVAG